jgi:uncharacterized protein (TIGR03086 family)
VPETCDLVPIANVVSSLLPQVREDQLAAPTPCAEMNVSHLLFHLLGLSTAFRDAARKDLGPTTATPPDQAPGDLPADWRTSLPLAMTEMARSWREPAAWQGETQAGGATLPAAMMGRFGFNELLIHGWDLARATGQGYRPDESDVLVSYELLRSMREQGQGAPMFGPEVSVPADAPLLDRVVGLGGRRPDWAG